MTLKRLFRNALVQVFPERGYDAIQMMPLGFLSESRIIAICFGGS